MCITKIAEDKVTLSNGTVLSFKQAVQSLRLAYALTYASCQGLTLKGVVRLESTDSVFYTRKHLHVGSSRATSFDLLEVC